MERQIEAPITVNSKRKLVKTVLLILAGLAACAFFVLHFVVPSVKSESKSPSEKLGDLYFSTLPLKEDPYPYILPRADDFTREE